MKINKTYIIFFVLLITVNIYPSNKWTIYEDCNFGCKILDQIMYANQNYTRDYLTNRVIVPTGTIKSWSLLDESEFYINWTNKFFLQKSRRQDDVRRLIIDFDYYYFGENMYCHDQGLVKHYNLTIHWGINSLDILNFWCGEYPHFSIYEDYNKIILAYYNDKFLKKLDFNEIEKVKSKNLYYYIFDKNEEQMIFWRTDLKIKILRKDCD